MHRLCRNRGRRIRPSDKDLVFRTVFFLLFAVFAVTFVLLNIRTDWRSPSVAYLLFSAAMGGKVCTVTIWLLPVSGQAARNAPSAKAGAHGTGKPVV